ncbi:tetratricopeptide repeat protein 31-like protein [Leptotrombidium deliense]|uniref:Tetratricopeptide repeat protein 31-like protein n=1 Tax=Leptotrombidium deliense TaxID=299467 RepID=A0A443S7P8_9ACAR|nr:tetratricopeptide repeat protein 31-like protein [Leptotrombidium deliense]
MSSAISVRPPPGLESNVSLTSIASILVPNKKLATIENEENFERMKQQITATNINQQRRKSLSSQFVDDRSNRHKRSTELAAVANNCALNKDFDSAVTFYSEAIDLNPSDFRFYCNRSFCYENIKQYNNSLEDALKAIQLNPRRPKPYFRKDAALLAAKRCNCISEAIDFVVNVELLSLKTSDSSDYSASEERSLSVSTDCTSRSASIATTDSLHAYRLKAENEKLHRDYLQRSNGLNNGSNVTTHNYQTTNESESQKSFVGPTNLFGYKGLWVGNIYPKANALTLRSLFSKYGRVTNVKILKDKFCAFISYDNPISPRKAIADLNENCVKNVSNEYRPLKFRFIPTNDQPDLNFARPVQPRNNNNECYFWRTTGCNAGDKCKLRHIHICKGIDFQPWMSRL